MSKSLLINFSKITNLRPAVSDFDLIDLSYSIVNYKNNIKELVDFDSVVPKGLELYKNFIEKLLQEENFLKIKINDFSVYWLTDCAIKGYAWHWGRDFFLMVQILESYQQKIEKDYREVIIYLPQKWSFLKESLNNLVYNLKYKREVKVLILEESTKRNNLFFSFYRLNRNWFRNVLKLSKVSVSANKLGENILLRYQKIDENKDTLTHSIAQLFERNNKTIESLPYYWKGNPKIPFTFNNIKPTFFQLIGNLIKINFVFIQSFFLQKKAIEVNSKLSISTVFIQEELRNTLNANAHLFIFHQWLLNYFSSIETNHNLFYENELYFVGRIISHAAKKNPNIKTYGLQHGHFMEAHTVYMIANAEIKVGLPMPNHFITWGSFYNQLFLSNNSLSSKYTLPLGNPNYIVDKQRSELPKTINKILWCLTTKECMQAEWEIIEESMMDLDFELRVRLHPNPHIQKAEVVGLLINKISFNFDESNSIETAIRKNDLILVSSHSTTFLDAIVEGKFCIRLQTRFWDGNFKFTSNSLKTVDSKFDFQKELRELRQLTEFNFTSVDEIEFSTEKWSSFLR